MGKFGSTRTHINETRTCAHGCGYHENIPMGYHQAHHQQHQHCPSTIYHPPLVIGTGLQTRAGLAAGLQGYGYGYKISTLAKPVPLATGITQYIIYLHNTEEKKNVSKERGFIYRLPFACVCTLINKDTLIRVQAHAQ